MRVIRREKIAKMWATKIMIYHRRPPVKIMGNVADMEIATFVQHEKPHKEDVV